MEFKELEQLIKDETVYTLLEDEAPSDFPKFDVVERNSGYDDGDESLEAILHFTESNLYVKVTGYYQSYGGGTTWYNNVTQVFPQQKMVTVFTTAQ